MLERDRSDRLDVKVCDCDCLFCVYIYIYSFNRRHSKITFLFLFSHFLQTSKDRFNERQSALERKAALYDRLVSGQVHEEEAERYEVDFLSKGVAQHHHHHQEHERKLMYAEDVDILRGSGGLFSADMAREKQRREWEAGVHREAEEEEVADERRLVIEQIEKKTREERNRAEAARQERIAVQTRKRERLKAEFLKQKLIEAKKNIN